MVEIPAALGQLGHEAEIHTIFHLISLPFGERKKKPAIFSRASQFIHALPFSYVSGLPIA